MQKKAKFPFRFFNSSLLVEITGQRAAHLKQFIEVLKGIDLSSIFYHMHHSFREYQFAPGEYSNDFARWAAEDLEEHVLAERLALINLRDFTDLNAVRTRLVEIIEDHLGRIVETRKAVPGREFYFCKGITVVIPTPYEAWDLKEFSHGLRQVGMRSLYFHFFDARLKLGHPSNDFSKWFEDALGEKELAKAVESLDPYFMTMDELKDKIISLCLDKGEGKKKFDFKSWWERVRKR